MVKTKKPEKKKVAKRTARASVVGKGGTSSSSRARAELDAGITVDRRARRERREGVDRRKEDIPVAVERRKLERRAKVSRRRQIDPTTCERDYTDEEIEFMHALDEYKRLSGRMFPTCSEILEVVRKLGYVRAAVMTPSQPLVPQAFTAPESVLTA